MLSPDVLDDGTCVLAASCGHVRQPFFDQLVKLRARGYYRAFYRNAFKVSPLPKWVLWRLWRL